MTYREGRDGDPESFKSPNAEIKAIWDAVIEDWLKERTKHIADGPTREAAMKRELVRYRSQIDSVYTGEVDPDVQELMTKLEQASVSVRGPVGHAVYIDALVRQELEDFGAFLDALDDPAMDDVSFHDYRDGMRSIRSITDPEGGNN